MDRHQFPVSQGELIRSARAEASQADFASRLGVDRSCLSRYENEVLGAPTAVLNTCLKMVAEKLSGKRAPGTEVERALLHARQAVAELEVAARAANTRPR